MALPLVFVGIDVAKDWLDVWCEPLKHQRFSNDDAGHKALLDALTPLCEGCGLILAMEASGGYERALRSAALEAQFDVRVLNPLRVRLYARSLGQNAKNDRIDAQVIAHFAQASDSVPQVLDKQHARFAELVTQRRRLIDERVAISNQTGLLLAPALRAQNQARIDLIARQVEQTDRLIAQAVGELPEMARKVKLMKTVKGIKDVTATTLLAVMPELGTIDRRAIAALAGLAPFDHDSGKRKGTRCIAGGRAPARTALYMAARAAARSHSPLAAFYKRKIDEGKTAKVATVALMRKMLVTLNAILRDQTPWKKAATTT